VIVLNELKTTRVGALQKFVDGDKEKFLRRREVDTEFVFSEQKLVDLLVQIEGK
jgi:hypothetical protein